MRICGITQRREDYPDRNEVRDALDRRLCDWVAEAGFYPLPIPNIWANRRELMVGWLEKVDISVIVLSGGGNVGDDQEREYTEKKILDYAGHKSLPLLGICRGMQFMGTQSGGVLGSVSGHVQTRHRLTGEITDEVNSFHENALKSCPVGYRETSKSVDGVLEAMRHENLPWEGWMWHPEREKHFSSRHLERFKKLANI